jgi:hypothetical protein
MARQKKMSGTAQDRKGGLTRTRSEHEVEANHVEANGATLSGMNVHLVNVGKVKHGLPLLPDEVLTVRGVTAVGPGAVDGGQQFSVAIILTERRNLAGGSIDAREGVVIFSQVESVEVTVHARPVSNELEIMNMNRKRLVCARESLGRLRRTWRLPTPSITTRMGTRV